MTGYTNTNAAGSQPPTTGNMPAQSDTAAQGGYLGKAQGWTNRVTNNLQGQAEHLKGKFAGSGATGQGSTTGTGLNTTGTRTGYEPTGTGTGYSSSTGTTGYSDPNSGYSSGGNQPGVAHGHNAHLSQGYAPAQANSGAAGDGTYGNTAQQKPSYTDQAKTWTAKVADNLHGQAEYLKNKVAGPSTTTGQPTGTGYSQGTATGSGTGYNQGSGTGYSQGAGTPGFNQGTHVGQTQGAGAGGTPGYGQGADYSGAGQTRTHTGAPDPQAKKSWTDTAKQGIVGGLGYTQSGLEYVKNKVGGPTGSTGTGNTGSSYSTGQPTTGTTTSPNQRY